MEKITIYGTTWCGDCHRVRRLLREKNISFNWIDIDKDSQAEVFVVETNRGMRSVPTIIFPDGDKLVEPPNSVLEAKLRALALLAD